MQVAFVYHSCYPFHRAGGAEKWFYYIAKYLVLKGIEVEIIVSQDKGEPRSEIYDGIKYTFLPPMVQWRKYFQEFSLFAFGINLTKYLIRKHFDIIHSYTSAIYPYLLLKKRSKIIMQLFGAEAFTVPSLLKEQYASGKIFKKLIWQVPWILCLRMADAIVAEDESWFKYLEYLGVPRSKLCVLPQCVDIHSIEECLKRGKISREAIGLNSRDFVLLDVNRFLHIKGPHLAVDAFSIIKRHIPNAKLILVGGAVWEEEKKTLENLKKKIAKLRLSKDIIIVMNAPEEELYSYYKIADLFICPDISANHLLMSIIEAEACGLPIVSINKENLVKHGINGYVTTAMPQALAKAVIKIYNRNEIKRMGEMSRKIAQQFDAKVIADKAFKLYSELRLR